MRTGFAMSLLPVYQPGIPTGPASTTMKYLLLIPLLVLPGKKSHGAPPSPESPPAQKDPPKAEAVEQRTVIGIFHPDDFKDGVDRVDRIRLHLVSVSNVTAGAFVVDIALDSPLSRKQVDLMKRRVRQAGEDKVRRVLLKLTAQVGGKDRLSVTRGRIVGFKARKNAEFAGGALEETLVGDWPDVGFISLPPDERDGPGAREEPKPSATEPKGDAKPQKDASLEVGGKDEKNLNPKTNPLRSNV